MYRMEGEIQVDINSQTQQDLRGRVRRFDTALRHSGLALQKTEMLLKNSFINMIH